MMMHSIKGINEKYGITIPMLKKLVANKELTVVKIGTKNFIKEDDMEAYIEKNTVRSKNV